MASARNQPIAAGKSTRNAQAVCCAATILDAAQQSWNPADLRDGGRRAERRREAPSSRQSDRFKGQFQLRNRFGRPSAILASLRGALGVRAPAKGAPPLRAATRAAIVPLRAKRPETSARPAGPAIVQEWVEEYAMVRLTERSMRMAASNARAGADAAVTIAARTQGLMMPGADGLDGQAVEAQRMVTEKLAAAVEGAFAAQIAWGGFVFRAAFGRVRTVQDAAMGVADVAEAALEPAQRAVRANAQRLAGS
jgi:hypothetical protein